MLIDAPDAEYSYNTPNREMNEYQGRWLTPDPAGLAAVDLTNPQSWNMYAYVNNNPVSASDPSGLGCGGKDSRWNGACHGDNSGGLGVINCLGDTGCAGGGAYTSIILASAFSNPQQQVAAWVPANVCDENGCMVTELAQYVTVYPNIGLLGLLSATSITVTATDPWANTPSLRSQASMIAIRNAFSTFPDLCNPSVGVTGRAGNFAMNISTDNTSPSVEVGPVSATSPSNVSLNLGETFGGTIAFNPLQHTVTGLGLVCRHQEGVFRAECTH